ncbi:MAG: GvpL/GvpF family gas vesicle protein [Alphaproteobacteria bacterium]
MSSQYIYGVANVTQPLTLDAAGLAGGLQLVAEGDIGAIVGTVPDCDLRALPQSQAVQLLLRHQEVLEAVMTQTTVLPVKFGAIAPDEAAVRRMLIQGRDVLSERLAEFTDHLQMEIVVLWRLDQVFSEIATERDILQLRERAGASGDEANALRLGQAVKTALERRRTALNDEICDVLGTVATDMAANPLMDDRMAANFALLLNKTDVGSLEGMLNRLNTELDGEVKLSRVGPLPPSNFATVEVSFAQVDAITWARDTLELGQKASRSEIKSAYERLAQPCRPDPEQGRDGSPERMGDLAKAYRCLMTYAKAQTQTQDQKQNQDSPEWLFDASTAADMVMINVVRQSMNAPEVSGTTQENAA